jgi:hypothetical protein
MTTIRMTVSLQAMAAWTSDREYLAFAMFAVGCFGTGTQGFDHMQLCTVLIAVLQVH